MIDNTINDTSRIKDTRYLAKLMKADEAAALIPHKAQVGFSGFVGAGSPLYVPMAIAQRAQALHDAGSEYKISVYSGASTDVDLDGALAKANCVEFRTPFNTDPSMRGLINSGEARYLDVHLSSLAWQVECGYFGDMDFAVIEISGITEDGKLIPTTSVGNNQAWLNAAKKVILELNINQPKELEGFHDIYVQAKPPFREPIPLKTARDRIGEPYMSVDFDKVVGVVLSSTDDRLNSFTPLDEVSIAIGDNVAKFFAAEEAAGRLPKGKLLPLQSGIGNVANAVLAALSKAGYKGLECYSEVIQDGMLDLVKDGTVDLASASALSLSPTAVEEFRNNVDFYKEHIILRPQEISNSPELVRRLGVVAMNGMLEADIYGNINSTNVMGTQMMNGIGGSGDFARNGYLSLFLTPSVAKGGAISAIVPFVSHVDHTEHDTMVVVTEYGYADLRGCSPRERAQKMISIAHPDYRDMLQDYFDRACAQSKPGHTPHILSEALSWHDRFNKTGSMKK